MTESQFAGKFSSLPQDLQKLAADFIELLVQKAEAEGTLPEWNFQSPNNLPTENAGDSLEAQIEAENKLLDEEFERVLQTEGGPVRLEDLHSMEALKNTFQVLVPSATQNCKAVGAKNRVPADPKINQTRLPNIHQKRKLLFVCTVNRMRSATAHTLYETDPRFEVQSAGTNKTASTVLTTQNLNWADSIVVMEKEHRNFIRKHFPAIYESKKIACLYIPDDYEYMQLELVALLKTKIEDFWKRGLL